MDNETAATGGVQTTGVQTGGADDTVWVAARVEATKLRVLLSIASPEFFWGALGVEGGSSGGGGGRCISDISLTTVIS